MLAIADQFVQNVGDESEGFDVVEAHATGQALLGLEAELADYQLVDLRQVVLVELLLIVGIGWRTSFGANCMLDRLFSVAVS